ncbi:hypothetical protein [Bradyrhizobium sp. Bra64]|uniref:hypothetical protein n=1 Tax=Bradyrhizobium sp. Bra64 TaxID=2926009 RepID=UPI0021181C52|nr:hypothetical protein [Bradyrhizobium sp. Bra64]
MLKVVVGGRQMMVAAGEERGERPELVLCLCVAAGTDTRLVTDAFSEALLAVNYKPTPLRLSQLMGQIPGLEFLAGIKEEDTRIRRSMAAGNEIRRVIDHADAMARIALSEIHNIRKTLNKDSDESVPAEGHCFIVSSLKRAEELETLRRLFGQRVLLVSVYEPKVARIDNLCRSIARSRNSPNPDAFATVAEEIIGVGGLLCGIVSVAAIIWNNPVILIGIAAGAGWALSIVFATRATSAALRSSCEYVG